MRFRREALAATVLRHPNIVGCLETGTDDGQPFLVMELIEGEDLAARLRRVGRLAPSEAARIGLDVARALGVAHIRGIVHRDVKPGNILLARDGRAMVTDFGIARLSADAEGAVPGTTLGSVHYFSPEQAKGETTTAASDVYSLGLVLYESPDRPACLERRVDREARGGSDRRPGRPIPARRSTRGARRRSTRSSPARSIPSRPAAIRTARRSRRRSSRWLAHPDPASPTVATDTAAPGRGCGRVGRGARRRRSVSRRRCPAGRAASSGRRRRGVPAAPMGLGAVRRAPPVIAAPLIVLMIVVGVVDGGVAARGAARRRTAAASRSPARRRARPRVRRHVRPPADGAPDPDGRPEADGGSRSRPRPRPGVRPKPPSPGMLDACEPFFGVACGLDAGTYEPSHFIAGDPVQARQRLVGRGFAVRTCSPWPGRGPPDVRQRDHQRLSVRRCRQTHRRPPGCWSRRSSRPTASPPASRRTARSTSSAATTVDLSTTGRDRVAAVRQRLADLLPRTERDDPDRRHRQRRRAAGDRHRGGDRRPAGRHREDRDARRDERPLPLTRPPG